MNVRVRNPNIRLRFKRVLQTFPHTSIYLQGERKTLQVMFESVGGGTCLLFNYGDSVPLVPHAYGDDISCTTHFPHAIYHLAPELDVTVNLTHVYM